MSNGKAKQVVDQKPAKDAPKKDGAGRNLDAKSITSKASPEAPDKKSVRASVPGLVVEADDDDGAGMARVLSTLAGMVPDP